MMLVILLSGAMLVGMPAADEPPANPPDLEAYAAAKGESGPELPMPR